MRDKKHKAEYDLEYREKNSEKLRQRDRDRYKKNPEPNRRRSAVRGKRPEIMVENNARARAKRKANPEAARELARKVRRENLERARKYARDWARKNPASNRNWRLKNRERNKENQRRWTKEQYDTNPGFKILLCLRGRLGVALRRAKAKKSSSTMGLAGCPVVWLEVHLESLFKPGMTWKNHGSVWETDHIKPCSAFDLTVPDQQRTCFHWTNLQPLFAEENLKKSDTYTA